ncbi:hypothetical protein ACFTAO_13685 [Paenibacillus rhizoplanae]
MVEVDNLATLQDYYENDKSLNMEFVYRDEKLDQGCKFIVANTENRSIVVSDVGWTNFTLNKFVEMLNHFPMDIYNGYFFRIMTNPLNGHGPDNLIQRCS